MLNPRAPLAPFSLKAALFIVAPCTQDLSLPVERARPPASMRPPKPHGSSSIPLEDLCQHHVCFDGEQIVWAFLHVLNLKFLSFF
jgi:hypothetical protein